MKTHVKGKIKEEEEDHLTEPSEEKTIGSLNVGLITKMPLKIELQKLKTPKMCFQFP